MSVQVMFPEALARRLLAHLFRNQLEQGAFGFCRFAARDGGLELSVEELHLVPREGWAFQDAYYLELSDTERERVMRRARDGGFALLDCHSHPHEPHDVAFSPSDYAGIEEFAPYVRWKLGGRPYVATVWGRTSVDAVAWEGTYSVPQPVDRILLPGTRSPAMVPSRSWFERPRRPRRGGPA